MRDIRKGICPICAHQKIVEAAPAEFGDGGMEVAGAVTHDPRWLMAGRNPGHPHGPLRLWFCQRCGFAQTFVLSPGEVPISDGHRTALHTGPGAADGDDDRRRLETSHAVLYLSEAGLDQDWPNGAVHTIRWSDPFSLTLHRSATDAYTGPVADVHVRLTQANGGRTQNVAFTVSLDDSPEVARLPALTAFLPRVEGRDAPLILRTLKKARAAHGEDFPLPIAPA